MFFLTKLKHLIKIISILLIQAFLGSNFAVAANFGSTSYSSPENSLLSPQIYLTSSAFKANFNAEAGLLQDSEALEYFFDVFKLYALYESISVTMFARRTNISEAEAEKILENILLVKPDVVKQGLIIKGRETGEKGYGYFPKDVAGLLEEKAEREASLPELIAAGKDTQRLPSEFGPHPTQMGLVEYYEKIAYAEAAKPDGFKVKQIQAFKIDKHGMDTQDAISFGIILENGYVIMQAGLMGGISAGIAEPGTHASIDEAIEFFNNVIAQKFIGVNVADYDAVEQLIIDIDNEYRDKAKNKSKPLFSYIGSEISSGVSMIASGAFAERLGVPWEVLMNYRYNKLARQQGLSKENQPLMISVNLGVLWEGGKHGVAKYLWELVEAGIMSEDALSQFPDKFWRKGTTEQPSEYDKLRKAGSKHIKLGMIPMQEIQIMVIHPNYKEEVRIGKKLTRVFKRYLEESGIKTKYGAESGFTTDQMFTNPKDGSEPQLITMELVLDILNKATDSLGKDAKYVRWALDIAASEMYIEEIQKYYIGSASAKNVLGKIESIKNIADVDFESGLVDYRGLTLYKMETFKKYNRFLSVEDWAKEDILKHWEDTNQLIDKMIVMGDDNTVSNAPMILKFREFINAHLQKPNQSGEEKAMFLAVATSHFLQNIVISSHRGTRPELEIYTALSAIAMGVLGTKFTISGPGRGGLQAAIMQSWTMLNLVPDVRLSSQAEEIHNKSGKYKNVGWAIRFREEFKIAATTEYIGGSI